MLVSLSCFFWLVKCDVMVICLVKLMFLRCFRMCRFVLSLGRVSSISLSVFDVCI